MLIHVGIDTVELNGTFFNCLVKVGDQVKKGQTLLEFDIDGSKKAGYDVLTPVVVNNSDDYLDVIAKENCSVKTGDEFLTIIQ